MKPDLLALFTDDIKQEAARRFDLDPATIKTLNGFENVVLEASRGGQPYILRLGHSSHRSHDQITAELDWIDYLADNGAAVCTPLRSRSGELAERLDCADGEVIAVAFEKAAGGPARRKEWTPAMTFNRGKQLGRMHALTKSFVPRSLSVRRLSWFEESDFVNYRSYLPTGDDVIADRFQELLTHLREIPTDRDSFGLIHMDAHTGNIFFDGDQPTLFDFDDCAYDFFVSDIAISLFYAVLMLPGQRAAENFARDFLSDFLKGYRTENHLEKRWCEVIPLILKRREILLYIALYRGFDSDEFDDWCQSYVRTHRERIVNRTPVLNLDWSEFELG